MDKPEINEPIVVHQSGSASLNDMVIEKKFAGKSNMEQG